MRYSILYLLAPAILAAQTTRPAVAEHPLFGAPAVHDIYLEFKQPDYWQQLTNNFRENSDDIPYIEASFTVNGFQYEKIASASRATAPIAARRPTRSRFASS